MLNIVLNNIIAVILNQYRAFTILTLNRSLSVFYLQSRTAIGADRFLQFHKPILLLRQLNRWPQQIRVAGFCPVEF